MSSPPSNDGKAIGALVMEALDDALACFLFELADLIRVPRGSKIGDIMVCLVPLLLSPPGAAEV